MKLTLSPSRYLTWWLFTIFISSFVVSNTVKGTTPAFLFSAVSIPYLFLFNSKNYIQFFKLLGYSSFIYLLTQIASQSFVLIYNIPDFSNLVLISNESRSAFRSSLFSQSLYLICSLITFVYVINFYRCNVHDRYISISVICVVIYGFYLWVFFVLFDQNGDFISNREYAGGLINPSQFQTITISGINLSRFVSLTMEPSMYVFTVLPYFIYLLHLGYRKTAIFIFVSLILTFSGTFAVGMVVYALTLMVFSMSKRLVLYYTIGAFVFIIAFLSSGLLREIVNNVLISKLLQESDSGLDRFQSFYKHMVFFIDLPLPLMISGMGFGFIRSPELFSTLLVNTGFVGFGLFFLVMLYPVFKLPNNNDQSIIGLKCALVVTCFMLLTSVSEYSYPSIWVMAGIAYSKLKANVR